MSEQNDAEYVPLSYAVVGHLVTAAMEVPVVAVVFWVAMRFADDTHISVSTALIGAAMACVVSAVAVSLAERPFVLAARHPAPGGWGYAVWSVVLPPLAGAIIGGLESSRVALVLAGTMLAVCGVEALWLKPWQRGDSRSDVREKWEATKEMSVKQSLEDGWTIDISDRRDK